MAKLSIDQLKQLAAHGARARVGQLRAEIAAITRAFPGLTGSASGKGGGQAGRTRRRGKLSAAGRAAIVAAQKKRWAAVRKKKGAS